MQIASLGKARRQGGSRHNLLFKYDFVVMVDCVGWFLVSLVHVAARFSAYLVSNIGTLHWYRYPNSTLESAYRYRYSGTSIGTPFEINLVSILGKAYRYPSSLMELEYRYWLPSTGTCSLETVFGVLGSMFHCVLVPKFVMCDSLNLDDVLPRNFTHEHVKD
ncbi:hypothetical protein GQ457_06G012090 [Hibiscus cannabinus]